jgi:hypothetical protein
MATLVIAGCRERPVTHSGSQATPTNPEDAKCAGQDGTLVSSTSIGPVHLGRTLGSLRESCPIAMVKVPASMAIKGPVLGVSVDGGLILFTVAGKDSAVEWARTSSPVFRTRDSLGVGSTLRVTPPTAGTLCFRRDSATVVEILVSRRVTRC